jgi:sugar (pentulose or hexulose) kinase
MTETIAVFDIGKTNKKFLLFDRNLKVVHEAEQQFPQTRDEDNFECDDIERLKNWVRKSLLEFSGHSRYRISAVNFSTYGATLMYLDESGNHLTPAYNYLKQLPGDIAVSLYDRFGGINEFSRRTASPALGFLNSGLQILWLKRTRPEIFIKVRSILHFPQYFSHLLTGKVISEFTSIGCHTAMWDFDNMTWHPWLEAEEISLPRPVSNSTIFKCNLNGLQLLAGTGIHDSSAALAPYILQGREKFLLISTGTWCINMNPFNHEPLTPDQLKDDCLSYLSINQKPVKSSRLFMGHIHDVNLERLNRFFNSEGDAFKKTLYNRDVVRGFTDTSSTFFRNGVPAGYADPDVDLSAFSGFEEAYHRLVYDLTMLCIGSINLILTRDDDIKNVYVTGGFARNGIFLGILAEKLGNMRVFTSEIDNASALGAAMVIYEAAGFGNMPEPDLGLNEIFNGSS